jgi:hypothetical protein
MSLTEFNRQYPSGASLEVLALINQVERNEQLRAGQQVKRVVGEKFEQSSTHNILPKHQLHKALEAVEYARERKLLQEK